LHRLSAYDDALKPEEALAIHPRNEASTGESEQRLSAEGFTAIHDADGC